MTLKEENEKREFLFQLKQEFAQDEIKGKIEALKGLKVLVIGDAIIDEYAFCESIERAKKEPILVFEHGYSEYYGGGILAIANHVAEYADNVTLLTLMGNDWRIRQIVDETLNRKVEKKFFFDNKYPTLEKRRYVYSYRTHKMFEVYNKKHDLVDISEEEILDYLENHLQDFDIVIVADFGHGLITDRIVNVLSKKAKHLAINVQTNNGNLGFNLITKFKRADFISITVEELQLALQDNKTDLKTLIEKLSEKTSCGRINITMGKHGMLYYDKSSSFYMVPVFNEEVVDTTGAGDAVFSVISMLSAKNSAPKLIPFLGNCVGALAVKIMGNKRPVKKEELAGFLDKLLTSNL